MRSCAASAAKGLAGKAEGLAVLKASDVYTAAMRSCAASAAKGLAGKAEGLAVLKGLAGKAEGLAVLKEMEAIGVTPNQATFAVLMDVLAKAASFGKSKPREGWDMLRLMEQRGVVPDAAALFHPPREGWDILRLMEQRGVPREGWDILRLMEQRGVVPDAAALSSQLSLMARCAAKGADVSLQDGLKLSLMARCTAKGADVSLQDGLKVISFAEERGVEIDAFLFSSLLALCAHAKIPAGKTRLQAALAILKQLSDAGIRRDTVVYNNVLTVCGKCTQSTVADALEILEDMDKNKIEASAYTFSILLSQCANSIYDAQSGAELVEDAEEVMTLMRGRNLPPSVAVYNSWLKVLSKAAAYGAVGAKEASVVLAEMEDLGVRMNVVTLSSWLSVIGNAVLSEKATGADAKVAIVKAREEGLAPPPECYNLWIDAVRREALMGNSTAKDVIGIVGREALMGNSTVKDVIGIVEYMRSVGQMGKAAAKDVIGIVEYMRSVGQAPGTSTYNRAMSVALHAPGTSTYNRVMSVAARAVAAAKSRKRGSITDGKAILALMAEDEVPLSPVSLSAFIQLARADGSKDAATEAWKVFDAAPPSVRNEHVFTVMTTALVKAGQKNTAKTMLDLAKVQKNTAKTMFDLAKVQGLLPNTFMFNAAMGAAEESADVDALWEQMQASGVRADAESADVDALWEQMQASGVRADAVTNRYLRLAKKNMAPTRVRSKRRNISREKRRIKGEPPLDDR
ncbi:hypothetical protein T484DRAFT_1858874 [Baffinella frigidus]|nr:hypothetical protein T484DRAFT_1858874 [Cryptophyta sp. CCMP2293]